MIYDLTYITHVHDATKADEPLQSSSVSSDFTSKFLNLENPAPTNTKITSLMKTSASQDTIPPTPLTLFTPVTQQQQTPTLPTTTSTTIPELPDSNSIFKFDQRVLALEIKLSELKQTNQFAEAISSILGIVDKYLAFKLKEAVDVAVQLQTNKLREEAQAENEDFLNQVDTIMKSITKDQVKAQVSKIMPEVEKYVTESLGAEVLVRSMNQSQTAYAVAASLFELEQKKIMMDKMEANKSIERADTQMTPYNVLVASYNFDKDIISSYGDVVLLKRGHDDKDKDQDPFAGSDRGMKRRRTGKDADSSKDPRSKEKRSTSSSIEASKSRHTSSGKSVHSDEPSKNVKDTSNHQDQERIIAVTRLKIKRKYDYGCLEEIEVRRDDQQIYTFKEGDFSRLRLQDIKDILLLLTQRRLTNLTVDERYDLNVPLRMIKEGISVDEEMESVRQEEGSGYGPEYQQAVVSKEVNAQFREVYWWQTL
nr:hypothetical protein [Tanacetum cinerariifolium]